MHAVRQSCRPKHQVLILKCYPRFQKNVTEVKPNSSELSYLLYYASTRRSKLQKVGSFLEKKTANDVSKGRIGYVSIPGPTSCNLISTDQNVHSTAMSRSPSRYFEHLSTNYLGTCLSTPITFFESSAPFYDRTI